jgi:hypothetical protein
MERVAGLEPAKSPWKGDVLPLHHTRRHSSIVLVVGVRGLEPPTSASQTPRATGLRHTPFSRTDR